MNPTNKTLIVEQDLYTETKTQVIAKTPLKELSVTCFVISKICNITSTPQYTIYEGYKHVWTGEDRVQAIKYYNQI